MTEQEHEQHRRRCLVREMCRLTAQRGIGWLEGFVRGWALWDRIGEDVRVQWKLGNRGEPGDWR